MSTEKQTMTYQFKGQRWVPLLSLCCMSLVLQGCGGDKKQGGPLEYVVIRSTDVAPATADTGKRGPVHFTDMAHAAGIQFRNETGSKRKMNIPESIGQGVMLFDMDNDGDLDVYIANGGELRTEPTGRIFHNALLRNDGDWKFTDITDDSGLECPEWSCGVSHVDYDADGFLDVYVTQLGANRLFRNINGTGKFEDVTSTVGGGDEGWGTSAAFFDADSDGDMDLYVCNYLDFDIHNPPRGGIPCDWKNLKVCCGPRGLPEAQDTYYEFKDGRFVDRTAEAGFASSRRRKALTAYSLGVVASDVDNDGDMDIYVAVDSRPNLMFSNDGTGHFTEVGQSWQLAVNANATEQAGMGVEAADLNGDGRIDMFVTNFSHDSNTLYLNSGTRDNMYFVDDTARVGLGGEASYPFLSWGVGIHDFDCNGFQDIFVASGHVYPQAEGIADLGTTYAQVNQLFMGREKHLSFTDMASSAGPDMALQKASRGTAFGDIDLDGRIDVLVVNLDDWPCFLRNECTIVGSWLGLKLNSKNPANRSAIGARVRLTLDNGEVKTKEITGGGGYMGVSERFCHFGIPKGRQAKAIEITWPGGAKQTLTPPTANRWYRVHEGNPTLERLSP